MTPAASRSRACVSCCAASSRACGGDLQLLTGRLQIEQFGLHFVVDRVVHVLGLGPAAAQRRVGLEQPALLLAALEDRHVDGARDRVGAFGRRTASDR